MSRSMITLGMEVHKDSITLAALPDGAPAPTRLDRLPNDLAKLRRYCDRRVILSGGNAGAGTLVRCWC